MFFLFFLLDDRRIREAQHVDPMDPGPQHYLSFIFVEFAKIPVHNDVD
jgi:hypothetical protein